MAQADDIIAYGFGVWSMVYRLPTLGFGTGVSRGPWVVAAKDIRSAGPVAADIRQSGPTPRDIRSAGPVAADIEPS